MTGELCSEPSARNVVSTMLVPGPDEVEQCRQVDGVGGGELASHALQPTLTAGARGLRFSVQDGIQCVTDFGCAP